MTCHARGRVSEQMSIQRQPFESAPIGSVIRRSTWRDFGDPKHFKCAIAIALTCICGQGRLNLCRTTKNHGSQAVRKYRRWKRARNGTGISVFTENSSKREQRQTVGISGSSRDCWSSNLLGISSTRYTQDTHQQKTMAQEEPP